MIKQYVKNYSQALFLLCKESNIDVAEINSELSGVNDILNSNDEFLQLLSSPTVSKEEKINMVKEVFTSSISEILLDFICVIVENSRIQDFSDICDEFKHLYYSDVNLLEVTVTTTAALNAALKEKLMRKLEKMTGKNILLMEKTDKDLIGGIIIDYNDTQIDASIRSRLSDLKKSVDSVIA